MPTPRHEAYSTRTLARLTRLVEDPKQVARIEEYADAADALLLLDLEPARARLEAGYAPKLRGGKPRDCVEVWRVVLLGLLIGEIRYNALVRKLRANDVLRLLADLEDGDGGPGPADLASAPCMTSSIGSTTARISRSARMWSGPA